MTTTLKQGKAMQIAFNRVEFTAALNTVAKGIPKRTTKDILTNIKLEVRSDGTAFLCATDSEIDIRCEVSAECEKGGWSVLLPASRVLTLLPELTGDVLHIITDVKSTVAIHCGSTMLRMPVDDPDDYPPIAEFEPKSYFVVDGEVMRTMVRRTFFATDAESTRYALGGVHAEFHDDGRVLFAATDSRQLVVANGAFRSVGTPTITDPLPVIPRRAMKLIEKTLPRDGVADVYLGFREGRAFSRCGAVTISANLIQGRFPDWRKVFPKNDVLTTSIVLPVSEFFSAIRQAQIATTEESRGVDFVLSTGVLQVNCETCSGHVTTEMPVAYGGPDRTMLLDPRYLCDLLKALGDSVETITMSLMEQDEKEMPVLFSVDDYRYLIMPLSR